MAASIYVWEDEIARELGESFLYEVVNDKEEAIEKAKKLWNRENFAAIEVIDQESSEVIYHKNEEER